MPIMGSTIAETVSITENGIHDVARYTSANVEVNPVTTFLNVTPTTSAQQITPDTGVDGFDEVNVSAVTSSIDANIIPENIKKNVSILGVTGTHEGGGSITSGMAVTFADTDNFKHICGYIEYDDNWETKTNVEIPLKGGVDTDGQVRMWKGVGSGTGWLYAPFTVVSGSKNSNGVCTLNIIDKNNKSFSIKYLKNNMALALYMTTNGDSSTVYAPVCPKVGDEVFDRDSAVSRQELLTDTGNIIHFSDSKTLFYYDIGTGKRAQGPITIKSIEYLKDGTPAICLQDKNGTELNGNTWLVNYSRKYVSGVGTYNVSGASEVEINIPAPKEKIPGLFASAMVLSNGIEDVIYVRNMFGDFYDQQASSDFIQWVNNIGETCYTPNVTLSNYQNCPIYDNWALEGTSINVASGFYFGGVTTYDGFWFIKNVDYDNQILTFENIEGNTASYNSLTLPNPDDNTEMGEIMCVFDSGMTPPAGFMNMNDGQLYHYEWYDEYQSEYVYTDSSYQNTLNIKKFFGPAPYTFAQKYYRTVISVYNDTTSNEEYCAWDGISKQGYAIPFCNEYGESVYMNSQVALNYFDENVIYEDPELETQIGYTSRIIMS